MLMTMHDDDHEMTVEIVLVVLRRCRRSARNESTPTTTMIERAAVLPIIHRNMELRDNGLWWTMDTVQHSATGVIE